MLRQMIDGFAIAVMITVFVTFFAIIPLFAYGPSIERDYFPVIDWAVAVPLKHLTVKDDRYAYYSITFNKRRDCRIIPETVAWFLVYKDGSHERVPYIDPNFLDNEGLRANRPMGINHIAIRRVDVINRGDFISQKLVMQHRCHPLWVTESVLNIPISSQMYKQH